MNIKSQLKKIGFVKQMLAARYNRLKAQGFKRDLQQFNESAGNTVKRFDGILNIEPHLNDKSSITVIEPHYTYHPAWAARVIAKNRPQKHTDISSILHFSTIISAFVPTDFYDYRPATVKLENYASKQADLTRLPFESGSIGSLSCMHTIEHIGLGRYGDPIDYDGDLKAITELKRVLAPGGSLLIVTPIGKAKIVFNAHRIYSYEQIISYFSDLELIEFSLIPDHYVQDGIINHASKELADQQNWGCGCFHFKK